MISVNNEVFISEDCCHFEKICNFYNTCNISYEKIQIIEKFSLLFIILLDAGPNGNYYQRKKKFLTLLQRPCLVSIQHISRPEMDLLHFLLPIQLNFFNIESGVLTRNLTLSMNNPLKSL